MLGIHVNVTVSNPQELGQQIRLYYLENDTLKIEKDNVKRIHKM